MSDRAFVGGTIHVAQPEVFVEEVGSGVGVFVEIGHLCSDSCPALANSSALSFPVMLE